MKRFLLCLFLVGTVITTFSVTGTKVSAEPLEATEQILNDVNEQLQEAERQLDEAEQGNDEGMFIEE